MGRSLFAGEEIQLLSFHFCHAHYVCLVSSNNFRNLLQRSTLRQESFGSVQAVSVRRFQRFSRFMVRDGSCGSCGYGSGGSLGSGGSYGSRFTRFGGGSSSHGSRSHGSGSLRGRLDIYIYIYIYIYTHCICCTDQKNTASIYNDDSCMNAHKDK